MKPSGTLWGMPAPAVVNILQNIGVIALTAIAARSNMSGAAVEQYAALVGGIVTLIANQMTVHTAALAPPETFTGIANGAAHP